jgi:hypothetical protein
LDSKAYSPSRSIALTQVRFGVLENEHRSNAQLGGKLIWECTISYCTAKNIAERIVYISFILFYLEQHYAEP